MPLWRAFELQEKRPAPKREYLPIQNIEFLTLFFFVVHLLFRIRNTAYRHPSILSRDPPPLVLWIWITNLSQILSSWLRGFSRLWHRVVVFGPPGYIGWRVGTTTQCQSRLNPPVRAICQDRRLQNIKFKPSQCRIRTFLRKLSGQFVLDVESFSCEYSWQ